MELWKDRKGAGHGFPFMDEWAELFTVVLFIATLVLGALWLAIGSVARAIHAVSSGFLVAGTLAIVGSLAFAALTITGAGPVVASGIVLIAIIGLAYKSLRHSA